MYLEKGERIWFKMVLCTKLHWNCFILWIAILWFAICYCSFWSSYSLFGTLNFISNSIFQSNYFNSFSKENKHQSSLFNEILMSNDAECGKASLLIFQFSEDSITWKQCETDLKVKLLKYNVRPYSKKKITLETDLKKNIWKEDATIENWGSWVL